MKKTLRMLIALGLMLAIPLTATAAEAAARTVAIFSVEGEQVTMTKGTEKEFAAKAGLKLFGGYTVSTGRSCYAYLRLDEDSLAKLDQQSKVEVSKLSDTKLSLSVLSGALLMDAAAQNEGDTLEVRAGNSALAVRGTRFVTENRADGLVLYIMFSGSGMVDGRPLEPGQMMLVHDDAAWTHELIQLTVNEGLSLFVLQAIVDTQAELLGDGLLTADDISLAKELIGVKEAEAQTDPLELDEASEYYANTQPADDSSGGGGGGTTPVTPSTPTLADNINSAVSGQTVTISASDSIAAGETATLAAGATLDIAAGASLNVSGTLNMSGSMAVYGTVNVASTGALNINTSTGNVSNYSNTINNAGTIRISNGGALINISASVPSGPVYFGQINNTNQIIIENNSSLVNDSELNLNGGSLTNNGTLTNNYGLYLNSGSLTNNGMLTNNYELQLSLGSLTNNGTLTNNHNLSLTTLNLSGGSLANYGTLTNRGPLGISSGATLTNSGTLDNTGSGSQVLVDGVLANNSTLDASNGGLVQVNNGGSLTNNGTLDVTGGNLNMTSGAAMEFGPSGTLTSAMISFRDWQGAFLIDAQRQGKTYTLESAIGGGSMTFRQCTAQDIGTGEYYYTPDLAIADGATNITQFADCELTADIPANTTLSLDSGVTLSVRFTVSPRDLINNGTLAVGGGTLYMEMNADTDRLTNNGNFTVNGGMINVRRGTLENNGALTVRNGRLHLYYEGMASDFGFFINDVGAAVTMQNSDVTGESGYRGEISNYGQFTFTGGAMNADFSNDHTSARFDFSGNSLTGMLNVHAGQIYILSGWLHSPDSFSGASLDGTQIYFGDSVKMPAGEPLYCDSEEFFLLFCVYDGIAYTPVDPDDAVGYTYVWATGINFTDNWSAPRISGWVRQSQP